MVDEQRSTLLKEIAINLQDVFLNERNLCGLELIATGAYSPLTGFMVRSDYESVLDRLRLQDGLLWSVPYASIFESRLQIVWRSVSHWRYEILKVFYSP